MVARTDPQAEIWAMGLKMRVGPRRIIPDAHLNTADMPLNQLAESHLCPGVP